MKFKNEGTLKDALYNTSKDCTSYNTDENQVYGRGIIVGVIAAVMALTDCKFENAIESIKPFLPTNQDINTIPAFWQDEFKS